MKNAVSSLMGRAGLVYSRGGGCVLSGMYQSGGGQICVVHIHIRRYVHHTHMHVMGQNFLIKKYCVSNRKSITTYLTQV